MKKEEGEGEGEEEGERVAEQEADEDAIDTKKVIMVQCQYCEKQFN